MGRAIAPRAGPTSRTSPHRAGFSAATCAALLTLLPACTESHPPNPCGPNGHLFVDGDRDRRCAYIVIEGGFACPEAMPHRLDLEAGVVCSEEETSREELSGEICDLLSVACEGDARDGGPSGDTAGDRDRDGVPTEMDCDDGDSSVGATGERACETDCGSGTEVCTDGIWSACNGPQRLDPEGAAISNLGGMIMRLRGDGILAYSRDDFTTMSTRVHLHSHSPGIGWEPHGPLMGSENAGFVRVAFGPGRVVTWTDFDGSVFASYAPDGPELVFGPAEQLSAAPGAWPTASVGTEEALVLWHRGGDILARRFTEAGGWEASTVVDVPSTSSSLFPAVVHRPSDDALAVWSQAAPASAVQARVHMPGMGWQPPENVGSYSGGNDTAERVSLAVTPTGDVFAAWASETLHLNRYSTTTDTWSGEQEPVVHTGTPRSAHISAGQDGSAIVVWSENDADAQPGVWAMPFDPVTGWGPRERLGSPVTEWAVVRVTHGPSGSAAAVWASAGWPMGFRRYDDGAWGPEQTLPTGEDPYVGMTFDGVAHVAYVRWRIGIMENMVCLTTR